MLDSRAGRGQPQGRPPGDEEVGSFWDQMADRYDRGYESGRRGGDLSRGRAAAVKRLLGEGPGELLDAGMGPGRLLPELAGRGWTVTGVDVSEEMVAIARQRLPAARGRLIQAEIEALPFPDQSFDAVVVTGVLEYVAYRRRALEEVARVLRPGGLAVISIPNRRYLRGLWGRAIYRPIVRAVKRVVPVGRPNPPPRPRPPARERFEQMIAATGLSVSSHQYIGSSRVPGPLRLLSPGAAARLAERLDGRSVGELQGGQIVFAARKAGRGSK